MMKTRVDIAIDQWWEAEADRLNNIFLQEAIREWDLSGQGAYPVFIRNYVNASWYWLVKLN